MARRRCPNAEDTILGTMSVKRKNIRSAKAKVINKNVECQRNLTTKVTKSNEAYFFIRHSRKKYSHQTGKFSCVARSGNEHLMIVCVIDDNSILETPFKTKTKNQLNVTYFKIEKELCKRGIAINMHVLDNEAPELHKDVIEESKCSY